MPPKRKLVDHNAKRVDSEGKRKPHNRPNKAQKKTSSARTAPKKKEVSIAALKKELRRVRFILSKESTGADARIEAERKQSALQADIEAVEQRRTVAHTAQRYHKIKFIERTKVERKINKLKRRRDSTSSSDQHGTIQSHVQDARILLHYILTFPPEQKYVSLQTVDLSSENLRQKHANSGNAALKAAMNYHQQVREKFEAGELEAEPEVMLAQRYEAQRLQESHSQQQALQTSQKPAKKTPATPAPAEDESKSESVPELESESESDSDASSSESSDSDDDLPQPSKKSRKVDSAPKISGQTHQKGKESNASNPSPPEQAVPPAIEGDDFFDL